MKKLIGVISLAMITCWLGFVIPTSAQDAEFSQFYAVPLYLNPAFAGTDSSARLSIINRNEWKPNVGLFTTYSMEFDHHINALHSGYGLMAWKDEAGSGMFSTTNISGIYSFQQHVYKEFNFSFGIQGAYMQENLDWSKFTYWGQNINPRFPSKYDIFYTQEAAPLGTNSFLDLTTGIECYTKEFYGGISIAHISEPNQGIISQNNPLPMKYTTNIGAMIPVDSSGKSVLYFSPNVIIIQQGNSRQVNYGINMQGDGCMDVGIWYRVHEAFVAQLSVHKWGLRLTYSNDITVKRKFSRSSYVANELSLSYLFHSKPKNEGFHSINCPAF